jgi:hypothetical protein
LGEKKIARIVRIAWYRDFLQFFRVGKKKKKKKRIAIKNRFFFHSVFSLQQTSVISAKSNKETI